MRSQAKDPRNELIDRIDQLEDDLGRTLLLVQTLAELCVAKGLLTREEIAKMADRVDRADGVKDGRLDPEMLRPKRTAEEERKAEVSPEEHHRNLEERARKKI